MPIVGPPQIVHLESPTFIASGSIFNSGSSLMDRSNLRPGRRRSKSARTPFGMTRCPAFRSVMFAVAERPVSLSRLEESRLQFHLHRSNAVRFHARLGAKRIQSQRVSSLARNDLVVRPRGLQ